MSVVCFSIYFCPSPPPPSEFFTTRQNRVILGVNLPYNTYSRLLFTFYDYYHLNNNDN